MELDRNGFPIPAGFEEDAPRPSLKPVRGRLTIVTLILIFGALLGLAAQNKEKILGALASLNQRNGIQAVAERIKFNFDRGNHDAALRDTERLIRILPREKWPRNMRGLIFGQMKRYRESVAEFTAILRLDPHDAGALNNRAYNRALWRQELDGAYKDIAQAIAIEGETATYVDTRAYLNYLHGRHAEALKDLDAVLNGGQLEGELEKAGQGEVYFHRGLVHEQLGNAKLAEADFAKARALGFKDDGKPQPLSPAERMPTAKPKSAPKPGAVI